ncbi:unnamed protein product, partial [Iphiclides podalirius]
MKTNFDSYREVKEREREREGEGKGNGRGTEGEGKGNGRGREGERKGKGRALIREDWECYTAELLGTFALLHRQEPSS